jgi:two-component system chemotaxis sensor kinase CheA
VEDFLQDPALIQDFLAESEELLQGFDHDLIQLESSPSDPELLNRAFRALHTIKGTAGLLGFEPLVIVGHAAEEVLARLREGELRLSPPITTALLAARDELGKMLVDMRAGGLRQYSLDAILNSLRESQRCPEPVTSAENAENEAPPPEIQTRPLALNNLERSEENSHDNSIPASPAHPAAGPVQSLRVGTDKLDALVTLVGELVLERNRLSQIIADPSGAHDQARGTDSPLAQSVARLSVVVQELQAAALRTRMLPVGTVFSRFPRLVHDVAGALHKEADLVMRGGETEIDKTLVELVADPLVHLLRNSLDHGIETPQERELAGKPRRGTITLQARQEGEHILITVTDDGRGMDSARIVGKAIEKGLVTPDRASVLSPREILNLVFIPGFTTVENATDLSGRGVGMDVVSANLKKLNGMVEIESPPGRGTTVTLRLPLTLAIVPVLIVQVAQETYALPLRFVAETLRFCPQDVHKVGRREMVWVRNEVLPLLRLHRLLETGCDAPPATQKLVVLNPGSERVAMLVDQLVGRESTIVKPLPSCLSRCAGIAGATVTEDGAVRLVLDPATLVFSGGLPPWQEYLQ